MLQGILYKCNPSAAASGRAGWALAHPEFGSSVNPIATRGADYAHHITTSPPGFENPAASLRFALDRKFARAQSPKKNKEVVFAAPRCCCCCPPYTPGLKWF